MKKKEIQVKSKERVADFGEVYTQEKEVNAMLDLVKSECNKIESTFLEPACGNGNFLIKILERKMKVVKRKYKAIQSEYEKFLFIAVSSIYGIDIQEDNIQESIERLYKYIEKEYKKLFKISFDEDFLKSIKYVLENNLVIGDGLSCLKNDGQPILFAEWAFIGNDVKRKDYAMADMVAYSDIENKKCQILKSRKEYQKINFKEVYKLGK